MEPVPKDPKFYDKDNAVLDVELFGLVDLSGYPDVAKAIRQRGAQSLSNVVNFASRFVERAPTADLPYAQKEKVYANFIAMRFRELQGVESYKLSGSYYQTDNQLCDACNNGNLVDLDAPISDRNDNLFWISEKEIGLAYEGDELKVETRKDMTKLNARAIALLRELALSFSKHCSEADLKITSLVRSQEYQQLLAEGNYNAARDVSSHSTGFAFDVGFGGFFYNKDGTRIDTDKSLNMVSERVDSLSKAAKNLLAERDDFIYYREDRCMHFCLLPDRINT